MVPYTELPTSSIQSRRKNNSSGGKRQTLLQEKLFKVDQIQGTFEEGRPPQRQNRWIDARES
jgi:hypothetical protein